MITIRALASFAAASWLLASSALAEPKHGIAMHGEPALPPDFRSLPYANPDAPQGGAFRQAITGSFDSVNPFIVKGNAAYAVNVYVFESLLARNWAEPFALYGLLAESIDVSDDRQSFTFKIRPDAKFSDGTAVTADDVAFTMELLRTKGLPRYKGLYQDVKQVTVVDARTIAFKQEAGNRELPMIVGLMPILPKKQWDGKAFDATTLDPIIGSGPYVIASVKAGESITYRKNPDYWGKNLPINRGVWNFDEVRFDYYKDANATFEAFTAGLADARVENDPKRWSTAYDFPAVKDGKVVKEFIAQKSPAAATGLAFNTRRQLFSDVRVREALTMAFDFEWANANLFSGLYQRTFGFYSGSELSSMGRPADDKEKAVLAKAGASLRADFIDGSYRLPVTDGSGRDRKVLRKVISLLGEAGWKVSDKGLVNERGEQFAFTIVVSSPDQERIALHYQRTLQAIGIDAQVRLVDTAQYKKMQATFDFDMSPYNWVNSLSPGNEQRGGFGSAARDAEGSRNLPGVADPAVDKVITEMISAKTREDFVAAVRAEDRLLTAGFYVVPFYDAGGQWVARWNYIGRPDIQPLPGFWSTTLWRNP